MFLSRHADTSSSEPERFFMNIKFAPLRKEDRFPATFKVSTRNVERIFEGSER
jgi:hypothetical protein